MTKEYRAYFADFDGTIWDQTMLPPYVATGVPSQLHMHDKVLYYNVARQHYTFQGEIIDAGCLLGGTTTCMGFGLLANKNLHLARNNSDRPIKVFDKFIADEQIAQLLSHRYEIIAKKGDDFRPFFDLNTKFVNTLLDVFAGDLMNLNYTPKRFIEFLSLDICKGPLLTRKAYELFLPYLKPNKSLLIHQDYIHAWQPMIHWSMEFLEEYFTRICEAGFSVLFSVRKTIPENILLEVITSDFPLSVKIKLMDQAITRSYSLNTSIFIWLSKARMLADEKDPKEALALITDLEARYPEASQYRDQIQRMNTYVRNITRQ